MSTERRFFIGCIIFIALLIAISAALFAGNLFSLHIVRQRYWRTPEGIKESRRLSLPRWASDAVNADDLDRAHAYAAEMLKTGDSDDSHHAHTILGRIALRKGDIKEARAQLLASVHVSGTPVLKSFGPNMMLAKELLNNGESKTVLEYFTLCGEFWAYPDQKPHEELVNWRKEVQTGKTPDFGANVVY